MSRLLDLVHASAAELLAKHAPAPVDTLADHPVGTDVLSLAASPLQPLHALVDIAGNGVYVVYSKNGQPLVIGTVRESDGRRDRRAVVKELGILGDAVGGVRVVEVESEKMAVELCRVLGELFGGFFPVSATGRGSEPSRARARRKGTSTKASKKRVRKQKTVSGTTDGQTTGPGRPRKTIVELNDRDGGTGSEGDQESGFITTYAAAALGVEE